MKRRQTLTSCQLDKVAYVRPVFPMNVRWNIRTRVSAVLLLWCIAAWLVGCGGAKVISDQEHASNIARSREGNITVVSRDTIYAGGVACGRMEKDELFGIVGEVRLFPLAGDDCIRATRVYENGERYYQIEWTMRGGRDTACWEMSSSPEAVIDPIVKADIFRPSGFNLEKVRSFCEEHSCLKYESSRKRHFESLRISRDRSQPINTHDGVIMQGGITIGSYVTRIVPNGEDKAHPFEVVEIYFVDQTPCGHGKFSHSALHGAATILTYYDGQQYDASRRYLATSINESSAGLQIMIQYLVREGYL